MCLCCAGEKEGGVVLLLLLLYVCMDGGWEDFFFFTWSFYGLRRWIGDRVAYGFLASKTRARSGNGNLGFL
jgi:hypothetical protein